MIVTLPTIGRSPVPISAVLLDGSGSDPQPVKRAIDSIEPKEPRIRRRNGQKVHCDCLRSIHETDHEEAERPFQKDGDQTEIAARGDGSAFGQRNPPGREWQYEPKWDGFRCLLGRSQNAVAMQSKSGQDLRRYFPEIAAAAITLPERDYVLDGELVIPTAGGYSFDNLLQRIYPAESRIRRLAVETSALLRHSIC